MSFCLGNDPSLVNKVVPLGKIVMGDTVLERLEELCNKEPAKVRTLGITRIDVYPRAIVPESVKAKLGSETSGATSPSRPEPSSKPEPQKKAQESPRKDDSAGLPRVQFSTNRGDFTIELYEDDAPNTVAHFLSLVEKGFYEGLRIDRRDDEGGLVLAGAPAPGGKDIGYVVPDEPNPRQHHKAMVGLARRRDEPNTGGSRFYVCLTDRPDLDKEWTIFGVVVDGLDVVASSEPGTVLERATVLFKRDHAYSFNRFGKKE